MDSYDQRKTASDAGYEVVNKKRKRDQLVRDKDRLQAELEAVTKRLARDRLRLRDLEYAAKAKVPNVNAGHEWNYPVIEMSFVTNVEATCQLLKQDCNRLEDQRLHLTLEIRSTELQITSLRL